MKKSIFIYNPLSGHRNIPAKLDVIIQMFMEKDILLQPFRLASYDEERLLGVMKEGGFSSVIVSGGDGSVNSVVNLMIKNNLQLPLGLIPSGTCNDFARSLNIPMDMKKALKTILDGKTIDIDVGELNGDKYFVNTCAGGLFVDVSFSTSSELKRNFGPLAYYVKALEEVANIHATPMKITTDDEIIEQDLLLFLILNGKHAAGFNNIIEKADYQDGLMDIVLVKNVLPIDLPGLFFKVMNNEFIYDRNVIWLRTKTCVIEGGSEAALSIDGENGGGLPVSVQFHNKLLRVYAS